MKRFLPLIFVLILVFGFKADCFAAEAEAAEVFAQEVAQNKSVEEELKSVEKTLVGIELLAGYSRASKIRRKSDIQEAVLAVAFDLDMKPLLRKIDFDPPVLTQFQIEPFAGGMYEPRGDNYEAGINFWVKFGLVPESWSFQPYAKFGLGLDYMTLHTINQGTQFNFTSNLGLGAHYFFCKDTALTVEGRYRHLSNAGIKEPNRGINAYTILGGLTWRY